MKRALSYTCALVTASVALFACAGDSDQAPSPTGLSSSAASAAIRPSVRPSIDSAATNGLIGGLVGGLLGQNQQPLPLFVCQNNGGPYTGSGTVGLLGGTIHVGPHTLAVPPLAVFRPTNITATTYAGDTIAVTFQPQGLQFLVPPTLTLDYSHCSNRPSSSLQIDYLNDLLTEILSLIESTDNGQGQVSGTINHFSVYAASEARR
jgi:hypothetical protein